MVDSAWITVNVKLFQSLIDLMAKLWLHGCFVARWLLCNILGHVMFETSSMKFLSGETDLDTVSRNVILYPPYNETGGLALLFLWFFSNPLYYNTLHFRNFWRFPKKKQKTPKFAVLIFFDNYISVLAVFLTVLVKLIPISLHHQF